MIELKTEFKTKFAEKREFFRIAGENTLAGGRIGPPR